MCWIVSVKQSRFFDLVWSFHRWFLCLRWNTSRSKASTWVRPLLGHLQANTLWFERQPNPGGTPKNYTPNIKKHPNTFSPFLAPFLLQPGPGSHPACVRPTPGPDVRPPWRRHPGDAARRTWTTSCCWWGTAPGALGSSKRSWTRHPHRSRERAARLERTGCYRQR